MPRSPIVQGKSRPMGVRGGNAVDGKEEDAEPRVRKSNCDVLERKKNTILLCLERHPEKKGEKTWKGRPPNREKKRGRLSSRAPRERLCGGGEEDHEDGRTQRGKGCRCLAAPKKRGGTRTLRVFAGCIRSQVRLGKMSKSRKEKSSSR